ncbi:c-type cytochrome biogenesis protein CcsB [Bacillus sp. AFS040349]|uniref:c-type cytochrome biogenesis protein CcsB n=1 Tax=Bacillus sp. AFS040349 TaxID=2033502 RepID=UPI000BFD759D|nr:c-type cytochrome biogenesis protein CcsB [Bacillus sp. AFS040349]PGT79577.1 c-type cytochrome biogenesis protein CcsB [Bacillus sp. AFS040349]
MIEISSNLLAGAFFAYFVATILSWGSIKTKNKENSLKGRTWERFSIIASLLGFLLQTGYFFTRWVAVAHVPVSNMFEFTTFFGMMLILGNLIFYLIYQTNVLGLFALPTAMTVIAYASVFPKEASPLVPALQSYWLKIHVTTAALGEGILAISFIAGFIYLIRTVDQSKSSRQTFWIEFVIYSIISTLAFALVVYTFNLLNFETTFTWENETNQQQELTYNMPALVGPPEGKILSSSHSFEPIVDAPVWMNGINAPRKLNSVIWSLGVGLVFYFILRLLFLKRIGAKVQPLLKSIRPELLDEINYRSVIIGFPVFTLGALIFAMIWAQEAWTRFWGWDPKEVWALITFLFYAAYLHLRLSKGWEGEKSAWLAVIGFVIIMFNLVVVNLVIAGLHSYA